MVDLPVINTVERCCLSNATEQHQYLLFPFTRSKPILPDVSRKSCTHAATRLFSADCLHDPKNHLTLEKGEDLIV